MNIVKPVLFRQYRTLDAILIFYCLSIVGLATWSLVFRIIPDKQLPILAGFIGTVFGVISGYAAARFGTPSQSAQRSETTVVTPTDPTPTDVTVTHTTG